MIASSKQLIKNMAIFTMMAALPSCSVFGPVKTEPPTTYILSATANVHIKKSRRQINIYVAPITANSLYDTTEIAYSTKPYQVDYYVKNQWADSPARMLRPLIIKTLQNTRYFHLVTSNSGIGIFNYILNVELVELRQVFSGNSNTIHFSMNAELISTQASKVIATKQITVTEPVSMMKPYAAVMAANRAVTRGLGILAKFSLIADYNEKLMNTKIKNNRPVKTN